MRFSIGNYLARMVTGTWPDDERILDERIPRSRRILHDEERHRVTQCTGFLETLRAIDRYRDVRADTSANIVAYERDEHAPERALTNRMLDAMRATRHRDEIANDAARPQITPHLCSMAVFDEAEGMSTPGMR